MDNTREKLIEILENAPMISATYGTMTEYEAAADHLIANGVTIQKWIPVTKRLPEKTGLVMGYDKTYGVLLVYYSTDRMMSTWESITHWMPLPEPPKED